MFKKVTIKKSDFDIKCAMILVNRLLSVDDKARAILKLKRTAIANKRKSRF
jgi:hypothetical protein